MAHPTLPASSSQRAAVRQRWATGIDVAVAPLSFVALAYLSAGVAGLIPSAFSGEARYILSGALPGALWLLLVALCARQGQTVGQAVLGLRWMRDARRPAHWRPLGEPSFWCTALTGLLFVGCATGLLVATLIEPAVWRISHVVPAMPSGSLAVATATVLVIGIAILAHSARHNPAYLARL